MGQHMVRQCAPVPVGVYMCRASAYRGVCVVRVCLGVIVLIGPAQGAAARCILVRILA